MYLRWHYAIDVVAGLLLALLTTWIVYKNNPSNIQRKAKGQQPILEPCFGSIG